MEIKRFDGDLAYTELLREVEAEFLRLVSLFEADRWREITDGEMMGLYAKIGELQKFDMIEVDQRRFDEIQDKWKEVADKWVMSSSSDADKVSVATGAAVGEALGLLGNNTVPLPIGSLDLGSREIALVEGLRSLPGDIFSDDPVLLEQYTIWDEELRKLIDKIQSPGSRAVAQLWLMVLRAKIVMLAGKFERLGKDVDDIHGVIISLMKAHEEGKMRLLPEDFSSLVKLFSEVDDIMLDEDIED